MKHILLLTGLALGLAGTATAHAESGKKQASAMDLSNYAAEVAQNPKNATAYRTMAALPDWVKTGRGTSSPTRPITISGKRYLVGHICEPHNCAQNQMDVLFAEDGKKAWGLVSTHVGKTLYQLPLGDPDEALMTALLASYHAENPDEGKP
ncbi:Ivy family c-type lysozyme inhibitor [Acetobacter cibinongensis]|uniref:Ivy family c-type lysozyme inhibitor n=1 Tax=Acetobacter cibinongensis TaxID=146475 RepID=UPI000A3914FF|nr:Ivy family c-type lysozyme inhibitor [Acetobacter cibinongensis]